MGDSITGTDNYVPNRELRLVLEAIKNPLLQQYIGDMKTQIATQPIKNEIKKLWEYAFDLQKQINALDAKLDSILEQNNNFNMLDFALNVSFGIISPIAKELLQTSLTSVLDPIAKLGLGVNVAREVKNLGNYGPGVIAETFKGFVDPFILMAKEKTKTELKRGIISNVYSQQNDININSLVQIFLDNWYNSLNDWQSYIIEKINEDIRGEKNISNKRAHYYLLLYGALKKILKDIRTTRATVENEINKFILRLNRGPRYKYKMDPVIYKYSPSIKKVLMYKVPVILPGTKVWDREVINRPPDKVFDYDYFVKVMKLNFHIIHNYEESIFLESDSFYSNERVIYSPITKVSAEDDLPYGTDGRLTNGYEYSVGSKKIQLSIIDKSTDIKSYLLYKHNNQIEWPLQRLLSIRPFISTELFSSAAHMSQLQIYGHEYGRSPLPTIVDPVNYTMPFYLQQQYPDKQWNKLAIKHLNDYWLYLINGQDWCLKICNPEFETFNRLFY